MGVIGSILGRGAAPERRRRRRGGGRRAWPRARRRSRRRSTPSATSSPAPGSSRFDGFVNGLNRLPRPLLALSTLGLFAYAMAEPTGFGTRMQSLALVPEPLWWLLGAIVSFYFGARELHHQRTRTTLTSFAAARRRSRRRRARPGAGREAAPRYRPPSIPITTPRWRSGDASGPDGARRPRPSRGRQCTTGVHYAAFLHSIRSRKRCHDRRRSKSVVGIAAPCESLGLFKRFCGI